jgi:hypothetical protein
MLLYERLKLSKLSVPWDVDTWWNSTYRIFHRCFHYKRAIFEILSNSIEGPRLLLSEGEWSQLELLKNFLHVFFNATEKLSYSYIPFRTWVASASIYNFQSKLSLWNLVSFVIYYYLYLIFFYLFFLYKVYRAMEDTENLDLSLVPIVQVMKEKFLKY